MEVIDAFAILTCLLIAVIVVLFVIVDSIDKVKQEIHTHRVETDRVRNQIDELASKIRESDDEKDN